MHAVSAAAAWSNVPILESVPVYIAEVVVGVLNVSVYRLHVSQEDVDVAHKSSSGQVSDQLIQLVAEGEFLFSHTRGIVFRRYTKPFLVMTIFVSKPPTLSISSRYNPTLRRQ